MQCVITLNNKVILQKIQKNEKDCLYQKHTSLFQKRISISLKRHTEDWGIWHPEVEPQFWTLTA